MKTRKGCLAIHTARSHSERRDSQSGDSRGGDQVGALVGSSGLFERRYRKLRGDWRKDTGKQSRWRSGRTTWKKARSKTAIRRARSSQRTIMRAELSAHHKVGSGLENCYATGNVSGPNSGGIVGVARNVERCVALGQTVTGSSQQSSDVRAGWKIGRLRVGRHEGERTTP